MDWTNYIIAGCTAISVIVSLAKILGKQFNKINEQFNKINDRFDKINDRFDKVDDELKEIRKDIHGLDKRIIRLEDRLEFSNKVVYIQHDELKEN